MDELFAVYSDEAQTKLLLIGPMETLRQVFDLRNAAIDRIRLETQGQRGICRLHFNGKYYLNSPLAYVAILESGTFF